MIKFVDGIKMKNLEAIKARAHEQQDSISNESYLSYPV